MYLKVPLQSGDILTAHLHVVQSHLRRKETEGLSQSTRFPVMKLQTCKLSADLNLNKQTGQQAF